MPEIHDDAMIKVKSNELIYEARYDKAIEDFSEKGTYVVVSKYIPSVLEAGMAFPGPALVDIFIFQSSSRKPKQFTRHA